jgi:hypothetical protein
MGCASAATSVRPSHYDQAPHVAGTRISRIGEIGEHRSSEVMRAPVGDTEPALWPLLIDLMRTQKRFGHDERRQGPFPVPAWKNVLGVVPGISQGPSMMLMPAFDNGTMWASPFLVRRPGMVQVATFRSFGHLQAGDLANRCPVPRHSLMIR